MTDAFDARRRDALTGALLLAAGAAATSVSAAESRSTTRKGTSMQAYEIGDQRGIASLTLRTRPVPQAGPGQAVIKVHAAALNHRDLNIVSSTYHAEKPGSRIPLGDGAGEVVEIGPGVVGVAIGDRVAAPHFTPWIDGEYFRDVFQYDVGNTMDGWLTQFAVMPATALVKIPEPLSYQDAAALGAAGVTAWHVIHVFGAVQPGDVVLTLGTGGVSMLALQIAKIHGAKCAITSSSDEKLAEAKRLGADFTVNYRTRPDWEKAILEQADGVDIVVETVGLSTLQKSIAACATNGRVGLLGALGGAAPAQDGLGIGQLIGKNGVLKGITSGSRRMLADLFRAYASSGTKPVVDKVFPFAEARAAYEYLDAGGHLGKVVISMR